MPPKLTLSKSIRPISQITDLLTTRKTTIQMIKDVFRGQYRMSMWTNLSCVFVLIYVLFPFDLITDLIPLLGWSDDAALVYFLIKRLKQETNRYVRFKAKERKAKISI